MSQIFTNYHPKLSPIITQNCHQLLLPWRSHKQKQQSASSSRWCRNRSTGEDISWRFLTFGISNLSSTGGKISWGISNDVSSLLKNTFGISNLFNTFQYPRIHKWCVSKNTFGISNHFYILPLGLTFDSFASVVSAFSSSIIDTTLQRKWILFSKIFSQWLADQFWSMKSPQMGTSSTFKMS